MNYTTSALQPITLLFSSRNQQQQVKKKSTKPHVSAACANCKKAHLACDVSRPCQRCISTDKADTCHDIQHKKRGRPKMMRDSNNKKIRPTKSSNYGVISFPSESPSTSLTTNDTMIILLSMDLCCARVSGESLEYLQLYPQEFSHRSIYDFLSPGESQQSMAKAHRCLLDNAVQHQQRKVPPDNTIRSSFEGFYSSSIAALLNIANGSLTLKQKLRFRYGSSNQTREEEEMDCKLYLGGGFGADLFDSNSLRNLYIVCVLKAPSPHQNKSNRIAAASVDTNTVTDEILLSPVNITSAEKPVIPVSLTATPMFHLPPLMMNDSSTASPTATNPSVTEDDEALTHEGDYYDVTDNMDDLIDEKLLNSGSGIDCISPTNNSDESDIHQSPTSSSTAQQQTKPPSSLLDKFRLNNANRNKQFIHPHELYYLQTTSSRLSSEAIAHTASPYLSAKLSNNPNCSGSSSLAAYNNLQNKSK